MTSGQIMGSVNKSETRQQSTVAPFICSTVNTIDRSAEQQYQPQIKETSVFDPYL